MDTLKNSLKNFGEKYNIREIAFDRWGAVRDGAKTWKGWSLLPFPFGQGLLSYVTTYKGTCEIE